MRITFVIATLGAGGSERAMQLVANHWAAAGHDVSLLTLSGTDRDFYVLDSRIRRVALGLLKSSTSMMDMVRNNLARVLALRREMTSTRPEAVVSFGDTTNVQTLLATVGLRMPVVICEQIDPRQYSIGAAWNALRRLVYPRAKILAVVSAAMATSWARRVVRQDQIRVIPNPVYVSPDAAVRAKGPGQGRTIAAMGRLVHQKGFDDLLQAFRLCADRHPEWSLHILGEGADRQSLEALCGVLRLEDRVKFLGIIKEPAEVLRRADFFVMSSRFEGFPLSLIEALACGLPAISTDCPTGPSEIIRHGIDGLLVPPGDVVALAQAMDRLMENQAERQSMSARAVEIIDRFGAEKIMRLWDEVLTEIQRPMPAPFKEAVPSSLTVSRRSK